MARRGENIFKRKDGRWEARILEHAGNGQKIYRSLYGKSYREVKAKKEKYYRLSTFAVHSPKTVGTFSDVAVCWLSFVKGTVKESTYTRYYRNVYSYLMPFLGNYFISVIDINRINRFKEDLLFKGGIRKNGLSPKTVSDILSVLKMIFSYAAENGYPVPNMSLIRNPRKKKQEIAVISEKTVERLEELLLSSDRPVHLGILLTLHTGIRCGELCGLRWSDFDFDAATVHINRTVERIADLDPLSAHKTKLVINEPKTENSKREIPLPKSLCRYLKEKRVAADLYLLTGTHKPLEPHTLYMWYKRFIKRNDLGEYTFHALRHTFATRGIASGFDAKSLSEILGHADVTTTLRCDVHPAMEQKRKQMENLFDEKIRGQKYGL